MNVMIFAAGFGTRMRPLTDHTPKALIQVANRPLLDHAIAQARQVKPQKIVVNTHYHADQITAHLGTAQGIHIAHEADILETGGGLKAALPLLGQAPVFTLNSDAIWHGPAALQLLHQAWNPDQMDGLLLLVPQAQAYGRQGGGDFAIGPDGRITRDPNGAIYTGAGIVKTDGLAQIADTAFSLRALWQQMLDAGRLLGVIYPGKWADVGHPAGIEIAQAMLKEPLNVH